MTAIDKKQIISGLWRNLMDMNRQLKQTLCLMSEETNISTSSVAVIFHLEHNKMVKMNDIAEYLSITVGAATSLIDKLEEQGWIERVRSLEDRRIIYVQLTPSGMDKMLKLRERFSDQALLVFGEVPEEKLQQLELEVRTMEKYLAQYNQIVDKKHGK
jgi:DNA-binding MarR family transcriptional regulator